MPERLQRRRLQCSGLSQYNGGLRLCRRRRECPYFVNGPFYINAYDDPYNLDADNDGIACEFGEDGWGT